MKKLPIVFLAVSILIAGALAYDETMQRAKIGTIYLHNLNTLEKTLSNMDTLIDRQGGISIDEFNLTCWGNIASIDQYPDSLAIDIPLAKIRDEIKNKANPQQIHDDVVLLHGQLEWLLSEKCGNNPISIYRLQNRDNSLTREFNLKMTAWANK